MSIDLSEASTGQAILAFHELDQCYHLAYLNCFDCAKNECSVYYGNIEIHCPIVLPADKVFRLPELPSRSQKGGKTEHLKTASFVLVKNKDGFYVAAQLLKQVAAGKRTSTYEVRDLQTNEKTVVQQKELEVVYDSTKTVKRSSEGIDVYPTQPHEQLQEPVNLTNIEAQYKDGEKVLAKWRYDSELHSAIIKRPAKVNGQLLKVESYTVNFCGPNGQIIDEDLEVDAANMNALCNLPQPPATTADRNAANEDPASYAIGTTVFSKDVSDDGCFNPAKVLRMKDINRRRQWEVKCMFGDRSNSWLTIENLRLMYADSPMRLDPNAEPLFPTKKGKKFMLQNSGREGRVLPKLQPPYSCEIDHDGKERGWRNDDTGEAAPCTKIAWRDITKLGKTSKGLARKPVVDAQEPLADETYVNGVLDARGEDNELLKWTTSDGSRDMVFRTDEISTSTYRTWLCTFANSWQRTCTGRRRAPTMAIQMLLTDAGS